MTKVLVNGAKGKMGAMIINIIEQTPSLGLQVTEKREIGQEPKEDFDLIIDFSLPQGACEAFDLAKKYKAAFLTGTTNMETSFIEELKKETSIPVFYSPNVSIGVYLFTQLAQEATKKFENYKISMHEAHHAQKKDAPSGTAKSIAAAINFDAGKVTYERQGTVPGTHSISLTSPSDDEEITLTHKALHRSLFAQSAVYVSAWLAKQKAGFYDMKDFVKENLK